MNCLDQAAPTDRWLGIGCAFGRAVQDEPTFCISNLSNTEESSTGLSVPLGIIVPDSTSRALQGDLLQVPVDANLRLYIALLGRDGWLT